MYCILYKVIYKCMGNPQARYDLHKNKTTQCCQLKLKFSQLPEMSFILKKTIHSISFITKCQFLLFDKNWMFYDLYTFETHLWSFSRIM